MEAVRNESDGTISLKGADNPTMLDRIVERFHDAYGEHAEDRLIEVDEILGAEAAADEAYPNLRTFIEDDLFTYHVTTMENTPILWKFTTSRLVSDANGEGFACFIDYHQIDAGLFDRLSNQYLEPRKAELRERRSAANRRRSDDSLCTSEQAEATEQYERCTSALEQISAFEKMLQDLSDTTERDIGPENRQLSGDLAPKVDRFRNDTETRLRALSDLRETKGEEWFEDTFSPNFWDKIEECREEWIDALEDLEHACEEYAKPTDEPVEAHLADLFDYFNWRLKGSDHYSSTGILFMTYYFRREGKDFLDPNGEPREGLQDEYAKRLATLAASLDEYKALADEIGEDCGALTKAVPADWSDRALSEITTAGYQPNRKHGVVINITPLADAEIVPKIVDETVI